MKRKKLLKLLHGYSPHAEEEREYKARMLRFVEENPDCFERSLEEGHITGSSWLLNKSGSKALLLLHAKLDLWVQPGGHCDGNPDVLETSLKEAREESGIFSIAPLSDEVFDIDIHLFPAKGSQKEHFHYDVRFLLQVTSDEELVPNSESKEMRWIGRDEELPTGALSVTRMFHKWKNF
jgi:8-oxo-dGTP pyrophosphatase MutT (NUDIX family)